MISAWWLFLIIPLAFIVGYVSCGVISTNSEIERCQKCLYNKNKEAN